MNGAIPRPTRALNALIAVLSLVSAAQGAAPRFWTTTPYQVRVAIALDGPSLVAPEFAAPLLRSLRERLVLGTQPLWKTKLLLLDGESRRGAINLVFDDAPATQGLADMGVVQEEEGPVVDKLFCLAIRQTPSGYVIGSVEHDQTTARWGSPSYAQVAEVHSIALASARAVIDSFSPLASFEIDTEDNTRVVLSFRGEQLDAPPSHSRAGPGEFLVPYLRQVNREGQVIGNGAERTPWTYLEIVPSSDDDVASQASAKIRSHRKTPFGTRRRGRIEQLALTVKRPVDLGITLRLHAQNDPAKPLVGYEVFTSTPTDTTLTRIGRTDWSGKLTIPPSPGVLLTHVRCGASVVASLPLVTGVDALIEVPLLDESARLMAEAKANALREELVDLVAVRRILAARIKAAIQSDDLDEASTLLEEYEELPGMVQFTRRLDSAEQLYRADHPIAQRRLERVFSETRSVLASSLSPVEARELRQAVSDARRDSAE